METSKVKSSDDANKDKSYTVVLYSELSARALSAVLQCEECARDKVEMTPVLSARPKGYWMLDIEDSHLPLRHKVDITVSQSTAAAAVRGVPPHLGPATAASPHQQPGLSHVTRHLQCANSGLEEGHCVKFAIFLAESTK